jgi:hypothetical protein
MYFTIHCILAEQIQSESNETKWTELDINPRAFFQQS